MMRRSPIIIGWKRMGTVSHRTGKTVTITKNTIQKYNYNIKNIYNENIIRT